MNSDILARIQLRLPALSQAEARVARWVIGHSRKAAASAMAQIAGAAGVSEPTVVRFCRSLGLTGLRELRTLLIVAVQHPDRFLHQNVDADDDVSEAAGKVLDTTVRALVNLRSVAAGMPFDAAVEVLQGARQLLFVGLGASGLVARDAEHKFFRLGIPCTAATDLQTILQHAAIARPGDVLLATSHSGTWIELVDAMALARENSAAVIAITDPTSPLAKVANMTFETHPTEDTNVYTPMSSRLVQLALLDALQVVLALALGNNAEDNLKRSKAALVAFRRGA